MGEGISIAMPQGCLNAPDEGGTGGLLEWSGAASSQCPSGSCDVCGARLCVEAVLSLSAVDGSANGEGMRGAGSVG